MNRKSKKGFTLVEIMIVVVIIGLLAAMAIPAFQKVRENSIRSRMDNDARQLASAAQQYFMEHNVALVGIDYDSSDGSVDGLDGYLSSIGRGYDWVITAGGTGNLETDEPFSMGHPLLGNNQNTANRQYNAEGQYLGDP